MSAGTPLRLFQGFGIELEYMVVDAASLSIAPIADQILHEVTGEYSDYESEKTAWSNELVLHVIELKTNGPAPSLDPLPDLFLSDVRKINSILRPRGARLMPGAMHPWMDPRVESHLWPHEYSLVYEAFDRIFDCSGHGWSNLQSMHINLPFGSDEEFGRLHAAIRILLPILPALAASSPIVESRATGLLDNRLEFYRKNARRVPAVAGNVIPEVASSRAEYEREILEKVYAGLAPFDPEGILRHEWANARGAIARFDRDAIEIRVLDVQECAWADLAIAAAIVSALRAIIDERWAPLARVRDWPGEPLADLFLSTLRDADAAAVDRSGAAVIRNSGYLALFGMNRDRATAGELWAHLIQETLFSSPDAAIWREPLETILTEGPLARRILARLGVPPSTAQAIPRERIAEVYGDLCDCLDQGTLFHGARQ